MNFAIATIPFLKVSCPVFQKNFYNDTIHTENDLICKESLSFVISPTGLPIDSETCDQMSLEELQSELDYDSDDPSAWICID